MFFKQLIILVAILMVAACTDNSPKELPESSAPEALASSLINRNWKLIGFEDVDGAANSINTETGFEFTIRFSAEMDPLTQSVSGINVCNAYSGEFTLEETILSLSNVNEDTGACNRAREAPAAMFARVLFNESAAMVSVVENRLEILSGSNERLVFTDSDKVGVVEINNGDLTSLGNTVFAKPRYQFFRDQQTLNEFYGSLVQCSCIIEGLPEVNFEQSTVLFVAHEIEFSGGYSIEIVDAEKTPDGLRVEIQKIAPGFNCVVTDNVTAPYQFYTVTGAHENVDFVERPTLSPPCN